MADGPPSQGKQKRRAVCKDSAARAPEKSKSKQIRDRQPHDAHTHGESHAQQSGDVNSHAGEKKKKKKQAKSSAAPNTGRSREVHEEVACAADGSVSRVEREADRFKGRKGHDVRSDEKRDAKQDVSNLGVSRAMQFRKLSETPLRGEKQQARRGKDARIRSSQVSKRQESEGRYCGRGTGEEESGKQRREVTESDLAEREFILRIPDDSVGRTRDILFV